MAWRVAKSLNVLLGEINNSYPSRSKTMDGSIGDAAHASRSSDHNPWIKRGAYGIVTARDFTHDPNDLDCHELADFLTGLALAGDPRIKYIIWNRRILNLRQSRSWRRYYGVNGHTGHLHLSVSTNPAHYDSTAPWGLRPPVLGDRNLRVGRSGPDVVTLQRILGITPDGDYGPATEAAVLAFQRALGLSPDGEVGPNTLAALRAGIRPEPSTYVRETDMDFKILYRRSSSGAAYALSNDGRRVWIDAAWHAALSQAGLVGPTVVLPDGSNVWALPVIGPGN